MDNEPAQRGGIRPRRGGQPDHRAAHAHPGTAGERYLRVLPRECARVCLDHVLVPGERHPRRILRDYVAYFNTARPHQGIGQALPGRQGPALAAAPTVPIVAIPVRGGLHHDYLGAA